jgi:flagellar hook-associated protein 2
VTLTLKQKGPTTITVAKDSATASNAVQAFVDAYNKFAETVASLTAYDATTQQGGALLGDAQVRSVTAQLRSALGARLGGDAEAPHSLSDIGVTVQRDGKLALDQAKLQKALETDSPAVANLFAGTDGLATRLDSQLDNLLTSGGPLSSRTSSLNKEIEQIGDQRDLLNQRMETLEKRYRAQFTALDQLVSQLTATGNYLTQQLANLPGASRE